MIENRKFVSMDELNSFLRRNGHLIERIISIQFLVSEKRHLMYYLRK